MPLTCRLDLSSHLLLSICCYVIRGYVAPSCILHGIFCFIIHDNPRDAYTSAHYTHAHACIDETACIYRYIALHCIIIYLLILHTLPMRLLTYIHTFILSLARMHIYIDTCKHGHAQAHACNRTFLLI